MEYEYKPRKKKSRIKRVHMKKLGITLLIVYGICTMISVVFQQQAMLARQAEDVVELTQQIEKVRIANAELENKIQFADTDEYVERIARDQLGYVKDGEIKIIEQK